MQLPRGLFVPALIDNHQYWFHLDTGFSGNIGITPAFFEAHPSSFSLQDGSTAFSGWRHEFSFEHLAIHQLTLDPYPHLSWARSEPAVFENLPCLLYREAYAELEGYSIAGIIGSGFLKDYDYALDYRLCRLYLWPLAEI
jgi:hypothetical protein